MAVYCVLPGASSQQKSTNVSLQDRIKDDEQQQPHLLDCAPSLTSASFCSSPSSSASSLSSSVRFAESVDTCTVPNLESYSTEEIEAIFMTEDDYALASKEIKYASQLLGSKRSPEYVRNDEEDICFLGLDFVTPQGHWIRQNLRENAKVAVRNEQLFQRHRGERNEDVLAAVYIRISMHAQLLAYARAVRNAMETNHFDASSI
jgi:hypothetical protein